MTQLNISALVIGAGQLEIKPTVKELVNEVGLPNPAPSVEND